jgi:hypothetical protein
VYLGLFVLLKHMLGLLLIREHLDLNIFYMAWGFFLLDKVLTSRNLSSWQWFLLLSTINNH